VSIGKGIIGSGDEEKSRVKVDWKQNMAYLVPPNGGKAIGWMHSTNADAREDSIGHAISHAIMYTIKISPKVLENNLEETQEWVRTAITTHRNALAQSNNMDPRTDINDATQEAWVQLSKDDSLVVRDLIHELLEKGERI
jgi:hypothetical protein